MNLRIAVRLLLVTIFIIIMIGVLWPTKTTTKHMATMNHILKITGSHSSTTTTTTSLPIKLVAPPTTVTIETTLPVSTTTTTVPSVPTTTTTIAPPVSISVPAPPSPTLAAWSMEAATKVAVCESGGWGRGTGGAYIGDLGIRQENWYAHGGTSDVSPEAQAIVAYRIQASPPDQYGCHGGW